MKTTVFAFTLFVCLTLPLSTQAQFAGSDDFAGTKDASKWGADLDEEGGGSLSQPGDGSVHYLSDSDDTSSDSWPWIPSYAPVSNSWTAQIDVNVSPVNFDDGAGNVGVGLIVFAGTDTDQSMSVRLEQAGNGASSAPDFASFFVGDGEVPELTTGASSTTAAVRISWDATTKTLSAEYDADGAAGGYSWTQLRAFDPTLNSTWEVQSNDVFRVALLGQSEQVIIDTTNLVYESNFLATQAGGGTAPIPTLTASQSGGQITLSWPSPSTGFNPESSPDMTSGSWTAVLNTPSDNGTTVSLTLPIGSGNQFFRLKKQP